MRVCDIFKQYSEALNKIGFADKNNLLHMYQAIYRIFALADGQYRVLHGSAVCVNDKATLFGDGGKSIGKTTQSLFLYKQAKDKGMNVAYVSDEYVLYRHGYVFSNPNCPVHCKSTSSAYMEALFGVYEEYLVPDRYAQNPVPLRNIVCPRPSAVTKLTRLYGEEARKALKCTAYSHLVKLHHPELDRLSLFLGSDERRAVAKRVDKFINEYPPFDDIPIYDLQIKHPEDTLSILESGGIFMDKKIKNHVSCGGVVFSPDMNQVYLIHKYNKTRDDWQLPKGHVEDGEDHIATALREIYEETGLESVEVLDTDPSGVIEYDFEDTKEPEYFHHKIVKFFGVRALNKKRKDTKQMRDEELGGAWIDVSNLMEKMTYENEKSVVTKTIDRFIKH